MSRDEFRLSFETVADAYERARPGYAPAAVEWIAERLPFGRVLDLAAGTGKLTRQLVARGADVVAVEPGEEMRAVLARVVPGVEVLAGSAEAIPLPDESVDTVTVAQAFHWFRAEEALAEIHRVLRPGGLLLSLDFDRPLNPVVRGVYLGYLIAVGSLLGAVLHGDPDTYRYIPESIRRYPGAAGVCELVRRAGFSTCTHQPVLGGFLALHSATK